MINFNAAILHKQNSNLNIRKIRTQESLLKGQVLVKINYSGICGSQIGEIKGVKGKDNYLPHLLGHEGSGTVIKKHSSVKKVKLGDFVILHWKKSQGIQSANPEYFFGNKNKKVNAGPLTTFNEYAIVSENRITKKPENISVKNSLLLGCALSTSYGVIFKDVKSVKNKNIVIYGCGGVGVGIIQFAQIQSAKSIIAVDKFENKANHAKKFGANQVLIDDGKNIREKIRNILKDKEIDVFIDTTGDSSVIELGYQIIGKKGKLVLVGVQHHQKKIKINTLGIQLGKKIIGSYGGNIRPDSDFKKIIQLFTKKNISFNKFMTRSYKLTEINKIIKMFVSGRILKRPVIKL